MSLLDGLSAEKVVNPSCLGQYQAEMKVFKDDLIVLNSSVSLVRQVMEFDADLFEAPTALLRYLTNRLVTDALLITTRVWGDPRKDTLGLDKMAEWLVDRGVRPEYRDLLRTQLNEQRPSGQVIDSIERMRRIRHARLAHLGKSSLMGPKDPSEPVAWNEVFSAADSLGRYYNACAFGTEQIFVLVQFYRHGDTWHDGDLGYVLEQVALGSKWFEVPEKHPKLWARWRLELEPEQLEEINLIRRRRQMPELD